MRTRPLLVTALVVVSVSVAHAWPPLASRPAPAAPAPTLDQLIDRLAEVRAQETELQARRADLERQVRDRLAEQDRRLQQVGVSSAGGFVPGISSPALPPFHAVDVDAPILAAPAQAPANVGFPTDLAPPPVARRTFSVELDDLLPRERGLGWTQPDPLADRFDALGGLPVAYNRWWRDSLPRRAPEQMFYFGGGVGLFGGN